MSCTPKYKRKAEQKKWNVHQIDDYYETVTSEFEEKLVPLNTPHRERKLKKALKVRAKRSVKNNFKRRKLKGQAF